MRNMVFAALVCGAALVLSACGEQENAEQPNTTVKKTENKTVKKTVKETAKAVDKTADYATGRTQLQQKKKLENKLNGIQKNQQNQLNDALKD